MAVHGTAPKGATGNAYRTRAHALVDEVLQRTSLGSSPSDSAGLRDMWTHRTFRNIRALHGARTDNK